MAATNYTCEIKLPTTKREGLANAIQMAINLIEAGNSVEAVYALVNLKDDVISKANPYEIGGKPRRKKVSEYRGDTNTD